MTSIRVPPARVAAPKSAPSQHDIHAHRHRKQVGALGLPANHVAAQLRTSMWLCLTDCDEQTREIAIGLADISVPAVRERLVLIAADPMEGDDNRRVAATRIS
ncbi:hypothetical protein ACFXG4_03225 [Nocardia sp. NPDC059246]|uniref:hypothetical protein n=1 Tax=unclassified Nocardia TaxID=2637762 RepID=UPI003689EDE0